MQHPHSQRAATPGDTAPLENREGRKGPSRPRLPPLDQCPVCDGTSLLGLEGSFLEGLYVLNQYLNVSPNLPDYKLAA